MKALTIEILCKEAKLFSSEESTHSEPSLFGVTDGKAVGTYLEHKFRIYLTKKKYAFAAGNSASGIDFPSLHVDMKVTSTRQPQSSCPFKSARQKIYGLGYSLIIFVYDKMDDERLRTSTLKITDAIFVEKKQTADFQMTKGLRDILANEGNTDDIAAFMSEKNLPVDEIELHALAQEIQKNPPDQGYLTISNALQWRLQYTRVIEKAGAVPGVVAVYRGTFS
ncbi:MAG: restriction endonuclease [Proteobacteria bacterium]|nr:restriction endonuclease [Pseudomonadota bacterium]